MSKKASLQRKSTSIKFDADMDLEAENETDSSLIDQRLKRQQKMVEDERHEKIIKKPKIDNHSEHPIRGQFYDSNTDSRLGYESGSDVSYARQPKTHEDLQILDEKSL
jgi:hypothetical protein